MENYRRYMDRQQMSELGHERLARMKDGAPEARRVSPWARWGAMAASLLLIVGLGVLGWDTLRTQAPSEVPSGPVINVPAITLAPVPTAVPGPPVQTGVDDPNVLTVRAQGSEEDFAFLALPYVDFADCAGQSAVQADYALPQGYFRQSLTREDIRRLFWGEELPDEADSDLPWTLGWGGLAVSGQAGYDGNGDLWELELRGYEIPGGDRDDPAPREVFHLALRPGGLPLTCVIHTGAHTTEVMGTEVSAWYLTHGGEGAETFACTSRFMAGEVGVSFSNVSAPAQDGVNVLQGAVQFNAMLIRQALAQDGGLHLDHLRHTDVVPDWHERHFTSLLDMMADSGCAYPYLPAQGPEGFGSFEGWDSYQAGSHHRYEVCWHRGYDAVHLTVELPLPGVDIDREGTVDVTEPRSYDYRVYPEGAIADVVDEPYRLGFYMPTFRAEDMTRDIIDARETGMDTGGSAYRFRVLRPDGTLVSYDCSGVTADYVWSIVEPAVGELYVPSIVPPTAAGTTSELLGEVMENRQWFTFVGKGCDTLPYVGPEYTQPVPAYLSTIAALFDPSDRAMSVERCAVVDLDGDGENEAVYWVCGVSGDTGGYLILHREGEEVRGYRTYYRTFWELKTDGSFRYEDWTGDRSAVATLRFSDGGLVLTDRMAVSGLMGGDPAYQVEGKPATEAAYNAADALQRAKPDAVWQEDMSWKSEDAAATPVPTSTATPAPTPTAAQASGITLAGAKEIALRHAGVDAAQAVFTEAELEHDDDHGHHGAGGSAVYELEFYCGGWEYEYKIRASDGTILEYSVEAADVPHRGHR